MKAALVLAVVILMGFAYFQLVIALISALAATTATAFVMIGLALLLLVQANQRRT